MVPKSIQILLLTLSACYVEPGAAAKCTKRAAVIGASVAGSFAALTMANHQDDWCVDLYEKRKDITREIQWAGRMELLRSFYAILGEEKTADYIEECVVGMDVATTYCSNKDSREAKMNQGQILIDDCKSPVDEEVATSFLESPSKFMQTTKCMESFLRTTAEQHGNIDLIYHEFGYKVDPSSLGGGPSVLKCATKDCDSNSVVNHKYDVVIVATGAKGAIKTAPNAFNYTAKSPVRKQVAGIVRTPTFHQHFKGYISHGNKFYLGGFLGATKDNTWYVTDVPESMCKSNAQLIYWYKYSFEKTTKKTATKVLTAFGKSSDELKCFDLQMNLVDSARSNNVFLFGDAVGNGHWSAGGGMQVGIVNHAYFLKEYLDCLGGNSSGCAERFAESVREGSLSWIKVSEMDFDLETTALSGVCAPSNTCNVDNCLKCTVSNPNVCEVGECAFGYRRSPSSGSCSEVPGVNGDDNSSLSPLVVAALTLGGLLLLATASFLIYCLVVKKKSASRPPSGKRNLVVSQPQSAARTLARQRTLVSSISLQSV